MNNADSYEAIKDVSLTLKKLIEDNLGDIGNKPEITFESPYEIKEEGRNKISIFLYHIEYNYHLRNLEPERVDHDKLKMPPLVLDLYYLITPYIFTSGNEDKVQDKLIIGKIMQIFYDNPILTGSVLQGSLAGTDKELNLIFNPISLEDITKLWSSFQDVPYHLSLTYKVTPVTIESTKEIEVKRVLAKENIYSEIRRK